MESVAGHLSIERQDDVKQYAMNFLRSKMNAESKLISPRNHKDGGGTSGLVLDGS